MPHRRSPDDGVRFARVLKIEAIPEGLVVVLGAGSRDGIAKDWHATVLAGGTDTPLAGGEVILIRIDRSVIVGKVHLTADQLGHNTRVRLNRN
jgi:hypothetical protein